MMEAMPTTVHTHQNEVVELPKDKASVQKLLRRHGMKSLAVDGVEDPRAERIGADWCSVVRVYCRTRQRLSADNVMRRCAETVAFVCPPGEDMVVVRLEGWVVRGLEYDEVFSQR